MSQPQFATDPLGYTYARLVLIERELMYGRTVASWNMVRDLLDLIRPTIIESAP